MKKLKPRNRAAQDATLINLRALKARVLLLELRLPQLVAAISLLANCVGGHIISEADGKRLSELLATPEHKR